MRLGVVLAGAAKVFAIVGLAAIVAVTGAFGVPRVVRMLQAASTDVSSVVSAPGGGCDPNGVLVGYDVGFEPGMHAYAVRAVRVVGIDGACDGGAIGVELGNAAGAALPGASAQTTVDGNGVRLPLPLPTAAADVVQVKIELAGRVVEVPPVESPVVPPAPAVPLSVNLPASFAPSFCPTITGEILVPGLPTACGAVIAPQLNPSSSGGSGAKPAAVAVASWSAGFFEKPVIVKLVETTKEALPVAVHTLGTFVDLTVVATGTNEAVTSFQSVLAVDFPPQPRAFVVAYSTDGVTWHTVPKLDRPELPDGQPDGYFLHDDNGVTLFTRHATFWSLALPPTQPRRFRANPLANGGVRISWRASKAGLRIRRYEIVRNGGVVRSVRTTRTALTFGPGRTRATFRVRAIDGGGFKGPWSVRIAARQRLVSRVSRAVARVTVGPDRTTAFVRARIRLSAPATSLNVSVPTEKGWPLVILPGSRVGGVVVGRATDLVRLHQLHVGTYRVELRIREAALRPGTLYRVRFKAAAPGWTPRPLELVFTAPR